MHRNIRFDLSAHGREGIELCKKQKIKLKINYKYISTDYSINRKLVLSRINHKILINDVNENLYNTQIQ